MESLHREINLECAQLSSVRSDSERLQLIVNWHRKRSQTDHSLLTLAPRKRVRSTQDNVKGCIFFHFNFFSLSCVWAPFIQHQLFLAYIFISQNWFGLNCLQVMAKKQLLYIILFVCIWAEHIIFFFFPPCLCLYPKKQKTKIQKNLY